MPKLTKTQEAREDVYKEVIKDLLPFFAPTLPNLGNLTPVAIVDIVGRLKLMNSDTESTIKLLNGVLDSKLDGGPQDGNIIRGETYELKLVEVTAKRLSPDAARFQLERLAKLAGEDPTAVLESVHMPQVSMHHKYSEI